MRFGVWLSLVECLVRDQEAGGSNPLTPTIKMTAFCRLFLCMNKAVTSGLGRPEPRDQG